MRVDKVIAKAAVSTFAAIVALCAFLLAALCLGFPSTMMKLTYDLGLDGLSVKFASTAYSRSQKSVYYIAYATEVAIGADDYENVVKCGKAFIADEEFATYAKERNAALVDEGVGTYEQYVYGKICVAEYLLGEKESALTDAAAYLGAGFPTGNALTALLVETIKADDKETAAAVLSVLQEIETRIETLPEEEARGLAGLISAARDWING
ncbi:MAG: hypothetical protein IJX81_06640 [Clostridia bacterium]|nr:hypothetical protein [Clostridia bacterium]